MMSCVLLDKQCAGPGVGKPLTDVRQWVLNLHRGGGAVAIQCGKTKKTPQKPIISLMA